MRNRAQTASARWPTTEARHPPDTAVSVAARTGAPLLAPARQRLKSPSIKHPFQDIGRSLGMRGGRSVRWDVYKRPLMRDAGGAKRREVIVVNERLRRAILDADMSLNDLAAEIGIDPKTAERWITKGRVPHPGNRAKTARVLGLDESVLWPQLEDARARAVVSSEVLRVYPHRGAVPPDCWYDYIVKAREHVDVLVYAGLFLSDVRADAAGLLQQKAEEGVPIRLLLGDPESEAVERRGAEEGVGEAMAARIRLSMSYLGPAFGVRGVEVRLHATTLYNSIFRFDDDVLVNTHAYGAVAAKSPVMHVRRIAGGRLFGHYMASFERVWGEAEPLAETEAGVRILAA
jgi:transcriptional regulator with XRE-family HTH domain